MGSAGGRAVRLNRRGRTVPDVAGRVESLTLALAHGGDRLELAPAEAARLVLARTDERIRLGAQHTVVALAGSTGSGKSSLFNALAGMEIAQVGARRPTTSTPTACVWGDGADALMDWLDVPRRHRTHRESELDGTVQDDLTGLVLLDLPDHDSTRLSHRLEVDRLVTLVDLLVWVVDPQKYADEALHALYLRTLTEHASVMLVVLNQVDRLSPADVEACRLDLGRLLADDGLAGVRVLTTSARTGQGVDDLRNVVGEVVERHETVAQRSAADLDRVVRGLAPSVGAREADPDKIEGAAVLVDALAGAAGVPAVLDAVQGDYRRSAQGAVGWPFTRWLRRFRPDPLKRLRLGQSTTESLRLERSSLPEATQSQRAQVELATRRVAEKASEGLPERWADAVRGAATPTGADLADALDQAVTGIELERRRPIWWGVLGVLQVLLAAAAVAGALWLTALFVVGWLQLPAPSTPELGPLPWPTVLLVGGLLAGLLLAVVGGRLAAFGASRRRRRTEQRMRGAVGAVADERVLGPVGGVLRDHRATRVAMARKG